MSFDRTRVWKMLGAPTDQLGSVNDPRTQRDYDAVWNEKWVYRSGDGTAIERIVLWNRCDLVGAFCLNADGTAELESLTEG